jgi:demethylmenaquinone methyltransferase/2-methoxy-6-polyprenyl-1,4-benzoquinol methylase
MLCKNEIQEIYRKRAARYDWTVNLFYLIGVREIRYRKAAVEALDLKPGSAVIELGCGTGLNFRYLEEKIGSAGRLIGVDFTKEMLERAQEKVHHYGWSNVELVQEDATQYRFPNHVDGIISSFVFSCMPEHESIIERAARSLRPSGRLVILDIKEPQLWPLWAYKLALLTQKPFGASYEILKQKPWETMGKYFRRVTVKERHIGTIYIAVGEM